MLITVYFAKKDEPWYRKAIIDESEKQFFVNLGAVDTQEDAEMINARNTIESLETQEDILDIPDAPAEDADFIVNGDKGSGGHGTSEWHRTHIISAESRDAVADYVKDVTGISMEIKGTLTSIKNTALKMIEEHLTNDGKR
jgi:hypothetical protein